MTGACHAPVDVRQGEALVGTVPSATPVPIEKSADFDDGMWAAALKQIRLRKG